MTTPNNISTKCMHRVNAKREVVITGSAIRDDQSEVEWVVDWTGCEAGPDHSYTHPQRARGLLNSILCSLKSDSGNCSENTD